MRIARSILDKGYLWVVAYFAITGGLIYFGMEAGNALRELFGPEDSGILALGGLIGFMCGMAVRPKNCCKPEGH